MLNVKNYINKNGWKFYSTARAYCHSGNKIGTLKEASANSFSLVPIFTMTW